MVNNITNVDTQTRQLGIVKSGMSQMTVPTPPVASFKIPFFKEKATLRVKKYKRSDNIAIVGDIDEHYVDVLEEDIDLSQYTPYFKYLKPRKKRTQYLKNSYVIDYIASPRPKTGLGTEAIKQLAEKAMFDERAEGRIVTYCSPVWREASPAIFFYKLGFRFVDPQANEYIEECLKKNIPDLPPQKGIMYLPRTNLHKLLRYGDVF